MWEQMKTIKNKVEAILENYPETRESDSRLVSTFLYYEIGRDKLESMSAIDLLSLISSGTIPMPDAITRVGRKLKEHDPALRGKNDKAKKKEEEKVRTQIINGLK